MDYLVKMIARGMESISPLARKSGDSNHKDKETSASDHPGTSNLATKPKTGKSHKVAANIDDRFKSVSDRKRTATTISRIDPWISNYVLVFLKSRSSISNFHPTEAPMIEILNRGGPFWDHKKHFAEEGSADLEGWMLVSDGLHSIKVWLTKECRAEIWKTVTASMSTPMYAFHNYSARQCGLLAKFSLKPIEYENGSSISSPVCELLCHSFRCQPRMQYMVVSDPNKIQDVNDSVNVKHAYQSYRHFQTNQSGRRWGNAKTVVDDPPLFDAILKALGKIEHANSQGKSDVKGSQGNPTAAVEQASEKSKSGDEEDDDGVPSMNIIDMLASPTEETNDEQPSNSQTSSHPTARRDLSNDLMTAEGNQKSPHDDETDYMGSLSDDALLGLNSQQISQPQRLDKENEDADSIIEVITKVANTISSPRKRRRIDNATTLLQQRNGKRIKLRGKEDWPNLPVFAALCKQLNDPSKKIVDIPGIQQPRVSLKKNELHQWLNKLGY
ncbi:MAG: hypothetical protein SGBAC_008130 [Bacillariaceae sp.]